MKDYLDVEYDPHLKAFTEYPDKLAKYIFDLLHMKRGQKLLEIGAGRCEMASSFRRLGLEVSVVDSSSQFINYAIEAGLRHKRLDWSENLEFKPFGEETFDYIFSKSFIEHIWKPLELVDSLKKLLASNGHLITLTPDFEANWWNFYDDYTHIKPFTVRTLESIYQACEFTTYEVFKIRQLPSTWDSMFMRTLSKLTAALTPTRFRTNNKWLRWSRELMIVGIAEK